QAAFDQAMAKTAGWFDCVLTGSSARIVTEMSGGVSQTALSNVTQSGLLEAVAYAIKRLDHLVIVIHHLELLAQSFDVAVDRAIIDIDLIVVGGVHQRIAAFHHARARRQCLQDQKFRDCQRYRLVLPGAGMTLGIHAQQSTVERLGVGFLWYGSGIFWRRAAQHGLHALNQQALRKGLADKIVSAHFEPEQLVDLLSLRSQ